MQSGLRGALQGYESCPARSLGSSLPLYPKETIRLSRARTGAGVDGHLSLTPDAELAKGFPGLKVWGHKDFILMRCMNTIMGADAKKAEADTIIQDALRSRACALRNQRETGSF